MRSRALAMHTLCALGGFAIGSAIWGALSDLAGLRPVLCTAAALILAGPLLARRYPLRMGEAPDVTQARPWEDLFVAQVTGESMNRRIPNGAWCLFRLHPAGTRRCRSHTYTQFQGTGLGRRS